MPTPCAVTTEPERVRRCGLPPTASSTSFERTRKPERASHAIRSVSSTPEGGLLAVFGRRAALGALELDHHPAQQRVELFLLGDGQCGGDKCFLASLDADRLLPDALAVRGQLHQDPAPVVRIRRPPQETCLLEAVEPVRHRAARKLHDPAEPAGRAAVDLPFSGEQTEELVLDPVELELGEGLVHRPPEAPVETLDAVDNALDLWVEHRQPLPDRLEEPVDVVAFLCLSFCHHVSILDVKLLDVKLSV